MSRLARVLITTTIVAGACGGGGASASATPSVTVTATLTDTAIKLDETSAGAGTVTFKVKNGGTVVHSLLLLKTDVPADKIPPDPKDASRVDTTGGLRDTGQIAIGQSKDFAAKLTPGTYVLVCNEPGHYLIGMHTPFVVK